MGKVKRRPASLATTAPALTGRATLVQTRLDDEDTGPDSQSLYRFAHSD